MVDFFHVLLFKKTHAVGSVGTGCKPHTLNSPGTTQKCFGVMWPPLGWCLLMSSCPRTATKVPPWDSHKGPLPGEPQAEQPPTSLSPLVGRGKEISPAAGTLPRTTIPNTAGAERDASWRERGAVAKPRFAPEPSGQQGREGAGRGCREDKKFLTHQFYRETPSSAAGWCLHGLCG